MLKDNSKFVNFFDDIQKEWGQPFVSLRIEDNNPFPIKEADEGETTFITDGLLREVDNKKEMVESTYTIEIYEFKSSLDGTKRKHYSLILNRNVDLFTLREQIKELFKPYRAAV